MSTPLRKATEACDLCGAELGELHQHLLQLGTRKLECACDACALLLDGQQQKYRRVPRRVRFLSDFNMTDAQWNAFNVPIGLAFFCYDSVGNRVTAIYPSPAGPVESQLTFELWDELAAINSPLRTIEADAEGLLVYRVGNAREHFIIPIDECFKIVAIIRMKWRGLSGGAEVWAEIAKCLDELKRRSS
jgi:uncharacterized protein DUF5947